MKAVSCASFAVFSLAGPEEPVCRSGPRPGRLALIGEAAKTSSAQYWEATAREIKEWADGDKIVIERRHAQAGARLRHEQLPGRGRAQGDRLQGHGLQIPNSSHR